MLLTGCKIPSGNGGLARLMVTGIRESEPTGRKLFLSWNEQADASYFVVSGNSNRIDRTETNRLELTQYFFVRTNGVYRLTVRAGNNAGLESPESEPAFLFWYGNKGE